MAALATGGVIRRWRARRHAARCPRCAAARDELRRVAEALADVPPLTDSQRLRWVVAAWDETAEEPPRVWWFRPALAGALAAVVLIAVEAWWVFRPVDLRKGPPSVVDVDPSAVRDGALHNVDGLRGAVVALAQELDDLRRRADLLEVRKEVDALMAQLDSRSESSGL